VTVLRSGLKRPPGKAREAPVRVRAGDTKLVR